MENLALLDHSEPHQLLFYLVLSVWISLFSLVHIEKEDYGKQAMRIVVFCRKDGITQSQLAKEFGIEGRNLFYVLKSLESQGLIVRQSAVVKTRDASEEGELRNSASVTTNLVYLSRYAKHLGSQQKFVITKEEQATECLDGVKGSAVSGDGLGGKNIKEDVVVKDYLPAMKAVCDLLENAKGKVSIVDSISIRYFFPDYYANYFLDFSVEGSCCFGY